MSDFYKKETYLVTGMKVKYDGDQISNTKLLVLMPVPEAKDTKSAGQYTASVRYTRADKGQSLIDQNLQFPALCELTFATVAESTGNSEYYHVANLKYIKPVDIFS